MFLFGNAETKLVYESTTSTGCESEYIRSFEFMTDLSFSVSL